MFSSIKNSEAFVQFALFVVAATYAVEKIFFRSYKLADSPSKPSVSEESHEKKEKEKHMISSGLKELVNEDGREEVKFMDSIIGPAPYGDSNIEDELLHKFQNPSSQQAEFQLPTGVAGDIEMEKTVNEVAALCIEEKGVKLEGDGVEYQDLKEKESKETDVTELQNHLKMKTLEADLLQITINSLQGERKKLQEDASDGVAAKKELQTAKKKIQELQKQVQLEANETRIRLLLLQQQVRELQAKEEEAFKKDAEVKKILKAFKELELDALELKRQNKELLHERRELLVELDSTQSTLKNLSEKSEMAAKVREEEISKLRQANEDLAKQVEALQANRFSPRSGQMARHLMLKYMSSEHGDEETDINSISADSEDSENAPPESSTSRFNSTSKKGNLVQKLKRWRKSKDDVSQCSSPEGTVSPGPRRRASISHQPRSQLEASMLRNGGYGASVARSSVNREMKSRSSFRLDL